jgi:formylglycine-generating enzyme required for sulfatase activity
MQCVPGGAFLLGSPAYLPIGTPPVPEQLVQVSPYFLDIEEVTVGAMKALPAEVGRPIENGPDPAAWCTYDPTSPASDAMPANCVSLDIARAACEALGKRLPTEAEWEWAAGNGELESSFPWAAIVDDPCSHAVVANAPLSDEELESGCFEHDQPSGPLPGGNPLDVTRHGIVNLGGNVIEWTSDVLRPYDDPECWGPDAALRVNPTCEGAGGSPVIRGGSWASLPLYAHGYERNANATGSPSPQIGFRCAK